MADTPLGWYKWYPRDFLASTLVRRMSILQQGIYRALLDMQWEDGVVPETYHEARLILGLTEDEGRCFEVFYDVCFPGGKNPKLDKQRVAQLSYMDNQKAKGGRPKKANLGSNDGSEKPSQNLGYGYPKPTPSQTETETETEDKKNTSYEVLQKSVGVDYKDGALPSSFEEFVSYGQYLSLPMFAIRDCWTFWNVERSWMDKKGPVKDWKGRLRTWAAKYQKGGGKLAAQKPDDSGFVSPWEPYID